MAVLDLNKVVDLVKAQGVPAFVERTGGNTATIYAGATRHDDVEDTDLYAAAAGPGSLGPNGTAEADTAEFHVGPDDMGRSSPLTLADHGITTEACVADLIVRQALLDDPTQVVTPRPTATELADKVCRNLPTFGGRQGFLSDPAGWLDHVLDIYGEASHDDHETARQAIDLIITAEKSAKAPTTAEKMVTELHDEWGVTDAYVMEPGPGTVHIPTPDGSVFLSDAEGSHPTPGRPRGHIIGRRYHDGRDEEILWEDPEAASITAALRQLAAESEKIPDGSCRDTANGRPSTDNCTGCEVEGHPTTSMGYCPHCADMACQSGDGDAVGLPVPADDAAAVEALAHHLAHHNPDTQTDCLVCALARPECPECGKRTDDISGDDYEAHAVVGLATGAADVVAVGCEGYVLAATRAAAGLRSSTAPDRSNCGLNLSS